MALVNYNVTLEDVLPSLESKIVRYLKQTMEASITVLFKICHKNPRYTISWQEFRKVIDSLVSREFIQYNPENNEFITYLP